MGKCEAFDLLHALNISVRASPSKPEFLEEVRRALRMRHYSIRTEQTDLDWIRQFMVFHGKRHPNEMGEVEVGAKTVLHWSLEQRSILSGALVVAFPLAKLLLGKNMFSL